MAKTRRELKLYNAYKKAKVEGKGQDFLATHPKFAKRFASLPARKLFSKAPTGAQPLLRADYQAAKQQGRLQTQWYNPTTYTPFGSSQVTYDEHGNPIYTVQESGAQQGIREAAEGLTQLGQQKAQGLLQNYQQFGAQDFNEYRQKIEDAVFDKMTRGLSDDYAKEKEQLEQTLHNRGIPLDPSNPLYNRYMKQLNDKYGTLKENARQTAIATGGQEAQRQFGMQQSTHAQLLNDMAALQKQGTGYVAPQVGPYQAPAMHFTSPAELDIAMQKLRNETMLTQAQSAAQAKSAEAAMMQAKLLQQQQQQQQNEPYIIR